MENEKTQTEEEITKEPVAEETTESEVSAGNKKEKKKKDFIPWLNEDRLERFVAIFLGITALLTAWATWVGALHGGNQATNYTTSNNIAADGNSRWNEASQNYMQDTLLWNSIVGIMTDIEIAEQKGEKGTVELLQAKMDSLIYDSCSPEFQEAILWALDQEEWASPFEMEGYVDSYYTDAEETLALAQEYLEAGQIDNANGDRYGLVTVIFSLVLFMLGIIGIFKSLPNRKIVFLASVFFLLVAAIYMSTIPLPSGFSL